MFFGRKKALSLDELPVWMDPVEFSQLCAIVETLAPKRVLEWGSGGSTRALLETFSGIEEYVAVEHNAAWADKVQRKVTDPRLSLHCIPPDQPLGIADPTSEQQTEWDQAAEFDRERLATYIDLPKTLGGTFDMVLVDGRARRFCIDVGFEVLKPGHMLVVHDAQRTEYHDRLHALGAPRWLEPWHAGQICMLRKPGP